MAPKIKVREKDRDEEFAILTKDVSFPRINSFETPTKCVKNLAPSDIPSTVRINEVTKRIFPRTIKAIQNGIISPRKTIFPKFLPNKLNLTIFDLRFDSVPDRNAIKSLASYWYASSQYTLFLPTVRTAMLKDGKRFSDKKIDKYVGLMRDLIELTEAICNYKAFIGTIPLMPIKYSRPIIQLYLEKNITAFAIDVGTKDFLNHETDFRSILTEINEEVPLNTAFIYACNLGIPRFEQYKVRADDFLSFFAYVDAFGTTFKTRGGRDMHGIRPKVKKFLREELSYEYLRHEMQYLTDFNQREQLKEADIVRNLVGEEKMQIYFKNKNAVDPFALEHLGSIAEKVKIY